MYVYLSVMILCCILLYVMQNDKNKIRPLAIVFSLIWLMLALQEGWGGDYEAYVFIFNQLKGESYANVLLSDEIHGEIAFKVLLWLMPSPHAGMVLGMGIWCIAMAFFFYHFVPQKWWWFAILFVFFDKAILMGMTASFLRMAIASSLLIFAVYYVVKGKRILSIGLIILGSLFHLSVLLMLPLVFVGHHYNKLSLPAVMGIFVAITLVAIVSPSSWIGLVEGIFMNIETFETYQYYFEESTQTGTKGLVLIVLFYWIYWLARYSSNKGYDDKEYLVLYYALIRIAFELLPAVGLSSRIFYYMDIYYFAGMMCVLNRMQKHDIYKYGIIITLLYIFAFDGFRLYTHSEKFLLHWINYNFIF